MAAQSNTKRSRGWTITLNNPTIEDLIFFRDPTIRASASHYVAQLEVGSAGTPHVQGYVRWTNAKAFAPTKALLRNAHIEAARGSIEDNRKYCTKPEGRLEGPWLFGYPPLRSLPTVLHPWQRAATDIVKGPPDDRTIYWFWEPAGNVGKSVLTWLWHRDFDALIVGHNARDAKCAVKLAWVIDGSPPEHPIIMFDLPRECQSPLLFHVIEKLKDGIFFSGKYKSSMVTLPLTHVVVFANEAPQYNILSADKLRVYRIDHALRADEQLMLEDGIAFNAPGT